MIVILCDGSCKGNPGIGAVGALVWDRGNNSRSTRPILKISEPIEEETTNNRAEWLSAIRAVEESLKIVKDVDSIEIFSDSQLMVRQIKGYYKIKDHYLGKLSLRLKKAVGNRKVNITWVPRQLTILADKEAREGYK